MEVEIQQMISEKGLEEEVSLCGYLQPAQVREMMEQAEVYLFTSDYKEGWGAVLNEAMNSGCAVLVSHAIGAAPFLLRHGMNGMVFESGNLKDMKEKAEQLLKSPEERRKLGEAAYETILKEWNAERAADRLVEIAGKLLAADDNKMETFDVSPARREIIQDIRELAYGEGPLSIAKVIAPRNMYQYLTANG